MNKSSILVVLITAPRGKSAEALAKGLVQERLAACVNIVSGVVSHYRWEGKTCRDRESMLFVKTTAVKLPALKRWIAAHHPNSVPELIALPIVDGSKAYLSWLATALR